MPTGNPEGYCGCCGAPCLNGYTKHDHECMWDDIDELELMERKANAANRNRSESNSD
jgi:hypothetical protein